MNLKERINRWRTRRGYGVHSPLAFRIVKNVVRPPRDVAYYGEEKLRYSDASGAEIREARMLLRLVAELQPAAVWIADGVPELLREAVRLAGCVVRVYDGKVYPAEVGNADMAVLFRSRLRKKELMQVLRPGRALVEFRLTPAFMRTVKGAMTGGVLLEGKDYLIALPSADENLHSYEI